MKANKIKGISACLAAMCLVSGCGTTAYVLTESEETMIVNYAAHVVSKHNLNQTDGLVSLSAEEVLETEEQSTEIPPETETQEPAAGNSLLEVFGEDGLDISYVGSELTDNYMEAGGDAEAGAGNQYFVLSFALTNPTDTDIVVDNSNRQFAISYTDDTGENIWADAHDTILLTDFSTYTGEKIAPEETREAVLLFEVPDSVTQITDFVLNVTEDDMVFQIKL